MTPRSRESHRPYLLRCSALLFALVLGLCACHSPRRKSWSFPCTGPYLESLERGHRPGPIPSGWPSSHRIRGGVEELCIVGLIVFLPLLIDLAILPVTLVHDIFW